MSLEKYAEIMQTFPYQVNPKANTLWIPFNTSNRTATLNLNHAITGFCENGYLVGVNGNCGTAYRVILVAPSWTEESVQRLAEKVVEKCNLEHHKGCPIRALKASRIEEIISVIIENPNL